MIHVIPTNGITEAMTYDGETLCGKHRFPTHVLCRSVENTAWAIATLICPDVCPECVATPEVQMALLAWVET